MTGREVTRGPESVGKGLVCTLFGRDGENYAGYVVLFLSKSQEMPIEIATDAPGIGSIMWILAHATAAITEDLVDLDETGELKQCGICLEMGHTADEHV